MSSQKDKYQKTTSFLDLILSKTDIALTTYPPKLQSPSLPFKSAGMRGVSLKFII